jgi:alkylation response protein AidB-like acyl-CoA dehydrogenase
MTVNLLYSDVEDQLRSAVRDVLADVGGPASTLTRLTDLPDGDRDLWRTLSVDVGCAGLAVPVERGGAGGSWREVAVLAEEAGRAAAPVPYLGASMGVAALLGCDADDVLAKAAGGEVTAVFAVPLASAPDAPLCAGLSTAGESLTGSLGLVADAGLADLLVVPAGGGLWLVSREHARLAPVTSLDQTRPLYDLTLCDTPARLLVSGDAAVTAFHEALRVGAGLLASEQLGLAEWCLATTVEYVRTRYQFARPVGSFQAVKHRLAQLWVEITQARAVARYAAGCLADGDPDAPVAVGVAQAHCSPVAVRAAEECVQLHGGIGFTWEHPAHLYLKRAKADSIALGTAAHHRAALGSLVGLPPV